MEMGTGKTKVTIDNLAYLFLKKNVTAALIIAPKSVYTNWETEIQIICLKCLNIKFTNGI